MKRQILFLIIYILISQQILSSAKYIEYGILSQYPDKIFLDNLLEKYDKLNDYSIYSMLKNMDPQKLQNIREIIGKIVKLRKIGIDSVTDIEKSLYSGLKSFGGYSKNAFFSTIDFLINYCPGGILYVYATDWIKNIIDDSNNYYERISLEIKNLISHKKYKNIIENIIGVYLQTIIEKGISFLNIEKLIEYYLIEGNILEKLNYKFNEKIDSLNFILLGDTGVGKSTLLNKILELNPEDNGAYVNPDFADPTTMEFKKYRNETKKGIELIDSRGIESNDNYNAKHFIGNFTNYFETIRDESNSNFIYGILFICETDSFSEIDILKYLKRICNNKIPLKLLYTKEKNDAQAKRINNTIKSKIDDIKPYFLKTTSNSDYEKNLNDFLKEFFEELNEEKLKDIYQYYYSLDIFNNFQFILEKINAEQKMLRYSVIKEKDPEESIINNLDFDLKFFLLEENIYLEDIKDGIKEVYNSFENELNEDFKKINYENYSLKKYVNRNFIDQLKEYFNKNHLPYDTIAQGISQAINDVILNKFLKAVQKEYFKNPIKVGHYPDFESIKNEIEKNFIKIEDKTNTKESNNYSHYSKYILIAIIFVFIIAFIIIFIKCFKKKEKKENQNEENEDNIELIGF